MLCNVKFASNVFIKQGGQRFLYSTESKKLKINQLKRKQSRKFFFFANYFLMSGKAIVVARIL